MLGFLISLRTMLRGTANDRGATAVEYGLMVALIAAVIIAVVGFLGADVRWAFNVVENAINGDQGGN